MTTKTVGPKLWCVVIREVSQDGTFNVRPLNKHAMPGAFPDACSSRFQAKKMLHKIRSQYPDAKLFRHQETL